MVPGITPAHSPAGRVPSSRHTEHMHAGAPLTATRGLGEESGDFWVAVGGRE